MDELSFINLFFFLLVRYKDLFKFHVCFSTVEFYKRAFFFAFSIKILEYVLFKYLLVYIF